MAKTTVKAGTASRSEYIYIQDSTSTTGAGLTGLVFNSAGLTAYYVTERGTPTAITLVTLASATAAYSSGGFAAVDATNMPGLYRFDLPTAVLSGNKGIVYLKGATNMVPVLLEYEVVAYDTQDTVRLGLTAIPNVASGSAGALVTSGTGTGQISLSAGAVTAGTVSDKTGYSLAASQTFSTTGSVGSVTGAVGSVTGSVGSFSTAAIQSIWDDITTNNTVAGSIGKLIVDNLNATVSSRSTLVATDVWSAATRTITGGTISTVSDKTGYSLTQSFPANFASLAITVGGAVTAGTVSDKTGYSLTTAPLTAGQTASAVWDALLASYTVTGSFGQRLLRSSTAQASCSVTGANHIAADIHEFQPGVITSVDFATDSITDTALAASAVSEIQAGLATASALSTVSTITDKLNTAMQLDGSVYQFTTNALELAPSGGGGGGSTVALRMGPYTFSTPDTRAGEAISTMVGAAHAIEFQLLDALGNAVDSTGATVTAKVYSLAGTLLDTYTATAIYSAAGRGYFEIDSTVTATAGTYRVTLTRSTGLTDTTVFGPVTLYVREV